MYYLILADYLLLIILILICWMLMINSSFNSIWSDEGNVKRMHTAVKLNEVIAKRSSDAQLVILNLPGPPKDTKLEREYNCILFNYRKLKEEYANRFPNNLAKFYTQKSLGSTSKFFFS